MSNLTFVWNNFLNGFPSVIAAVIILVLAFISASIIKSLVTKLMETVRIDNLFEKAKIENERKDKTKEFIQKLVYFIVFILWMPGFFEKLGMNGVASPIINMMNVVLEYIPNIIGAILLLIVGFFIAKTVKELLVPVFNKLKIDQYLKKIGVDSKDSVSVSEVLGTTVYVIILVPIIIGALTILKIEAISGPAIEMLNTILSYMPKVALALVVFFVGKFIAKLVFVLLDKLFESIGLDKISEKVFNTTGTAVSKNFSLSKAVAYIAQYVIITFFVVEALNVVQLDVLTQIGSVIIAYLPYAVSGVIMLGISILLANYVQKIMLKSFPDSKGTALLLKTLITILGIFITLYQLGVATDLVNSAFIIILGSVAVAFAIAFGIGGREFAAHMLNRVEKNIDKIDKNNQKKK